MLKENQSISEIEKSAVVRPCFCGSVKNENYYKYYTLLLLLNELIAMIFYISLFSEGLLHHHKIGFVINIAITSFLVFSYWKYHDTGNYGLSIHYYFSKIKYYVYFIFGAGYYLMFLAYFIFGKAHLLIHKKLYRYDSEVNALVVLFFVFSFPFYLYGLYLRKLYFSVIALKKFGTNSFEDIVKNSQKRYEAVTSNTEPLI